MNWQEPNIEGDTTIWLSEDAQYRITWRNKFMGVSVTPKYIACVKTEANGKYLWEIISKHNKLEPAQKACNRYAKRQKKLTEQPKKRRRRQVNRGVVIKRKEEW